MMMTHIGGSMHLHCLLFQPCFCKSSFTLLDCKLFRAGSLPSYSYIQIIHNLLLSFPVIKKQQLLPRVFFLLGKHYIAGLLVCDVHQWECWLYVYEHYFRCHIPLDWIVSGVIISVLLIHLLYFVSLHVVQNNLLETVNKLVCCCLYILP